MHKDEIDKAMQLALETREKIPQAHKDRTCVPPPIGCGLPVEGFRDSLSAKEYSMSGLCQNCQDDFFGTGEE